MMAEFVRMVGGKEVSGCSCLTLGAPYLDDLEERAQAWEIDKLDSEFNFHHIFCINFLEPQLPHL